jgi:hypothetical protein
MIEIDVADSPVDISGGFVAPADSDLLFVSAACFWVLQMAYNMRAAGIKLRQVQEADVTSAGTSLTTIMDNVLASIYTEV